MDYLVAYTLLISTPNPILGMVMGLSVGLAISITKWLKKVQRPFYLIPAALLIFGIIIPTKVAYQQERQLRTAKVGDAWAVEPLISALKWKKSNVRRDAARILGEIRDQRVVEPLINALKDKSPDVRKSVASALGEIGDAKAVEPLINASKNERWDMDYVHNNYVSALSKIRDRRAVEPLINALKNESGDMRESAASALIKIGEPSVLPLIDLLGDTDYEVRDSAVSILIQIGKPSVLPLINALKNESSNARGNIAYVLGEIGDPRAVEALVNALTDQNYDVCDTYEQIEYSRRNHFSGCNSNRQIASFSSTTSPKTVIR